MTASADAALELVVRELRGDPDFLAAWFVAAPDQGMAARARLNLQPDQWLRLLLCRAPRANRFADDISAVANSLDLVPTKLAAAIRETTALTALAVWAHTAGSEEDAGAWEGLLAAAHDRTTEQLGTEAVAGGWLRHRADQFWSVTPSDTRQQLDLETAIDQRQRVLDEAPDLLDAVDGIRPPTAQERTRAILARVPLGLHMHLLDRDRQGEAAHDVEQAEDAASQFALELLTPWDLTLQEAEPLADRWRPFDEVLTVVTNALTDRFLLPAREATTRARAALDALGVSRGFFDR